jgi:Peptidase M10 serralysin C terminal/Matrixin
LRLDASNLRQTPDKWRGSGQLMATAGRIDVTHVTLPASNAASHLIKGLKWGAGLGQGVTLTYSFATAQPATTKLRTLMNSEQDCITTAIKSWASVANITFREVKETTSTIGDVSFIKTAQAVGLNAYAYSPSSSPQGGDVWLVDKVWNSDGFATGSYAAFTVLHELGHALGLRHAFEGENPLPAARDNLFHTIMSYTASSHSQRGDIYASYYPTTPMYYDLLSMQALYGRNMRHFAGDTTYEFRDSRTCFRTIDDASGNDTMRYIGEANAHIDLRPGHASAVSRAIHFTNHATRATVFVGPGTVIERATGGNGDDTLIGNSTHNLLSGGKGRDTMSGYGGKDIFHFNHITDTGNTFITADVITDFHPDHDRISLSSIADFTWRGTKAFTSSAAELRYQHVNDCTVIYIDTDSDTASEAMIKLKGTHALAAGDFIL